MKVTCVSDLHGEIPYTPGGDLLIVAGDVTASDQPHQYEIFYTWLSNQQYGCKVVVPGNHDNHLSKERVEQIPDAHLLIDSMVTCKKLKIWGSPWTKSFLGMNPSCMAYALESEEKLADKWDLIPKGVDILVTHGPPYGILDHLPNGTSVGSKTLSVRMSKIGYPKLWVWGHIHSAYGKTTANCKKSIFLNCSLMDENYDPVNEIFNVCI